jgi:hypothetical protein
MTRGKAPIKLMKAVGFKSTSLKAERETLFE